MTHRGVVQPIRSTDNITRAGCMWTRGFAGTAGGGSIKWGKALLVSWTLDILARILYTRPRLSEGYRCLKSTLGTFPLAVTIIGQAVWPADWFDTFWTVEITNTWRFIIIVYAANCSKATFYFLARNWGFCSLMHFQSTFFSILCRKYFSIQDNTNTEKEKD